MARRKHISAVISLKDNMSATLKGIRKEQHSFRQDVAKTKREIQALRNQKISVRVENSKASQAIKKLRQDATYLSTRELVIKATARVQDAKQVISNFAKFTGKVGKTTIKPVIWVKDKATSVIKNVSSLLGGVAKAVAIPLTVTTAGAVASLKGGMELEQQQISMEHFMGVGNQGKSTEEIKSMTNEYMKELRNNANATPFETGEVISAGARALQISGGDTKKAMEKVKLAEDMASLNPGKTISDAMEAIADMEVIRIASYMEKFI